jgi:2'-5' RNA ligase
MGEAQLRLFVALEIPPEVCSALGEFSARLRPLCPGARWADTDNIHLTLKFIGEVAANKQGAIESALAPIRCPRPIPVAFRGVGYFPSDRHPRVFWVGTEAAEELKMLASDIERALVPLGIPAESRDFRPHLTLARFKSEDGLPRLRSEVQKLGTPEFGRAVYNEFDLMQSTLRREGALYTRLARFAFAPAASPAGAPPTSRANRGAA